jgi:DNA-binding transcriptional MerR regulator
MLDNTITKLYYTISEVAALVDEEAHVLRYWESEFEQLNPRKNRAGKRVYTREDIDMVFHVRHLLREDKYTIDGARQALERDTRPRKKTVESDEDLLKVRDFLTRLADRIKES